MFCKGWPLISASITIPLSATYLYTGEPVVPRPTHPAQKLAPTWQTSEDSSVIELLTLYVAMK